MSSESNETPDVLDSFADRVGGRLLAASSINTLQINLGLVCNLACRHCHVESSPKRISPAENMTADTAERLLDWVERHPQIETIDLTGGSPEMNPNFRRLVSRCCALGRRVMDRCNPTIISYVDAQSGEAFDWVPAFLAEHRVVVIASLPCYLEENVRWQRGRTAYEASIAGLQRLNQVGYGRDPELQLHLVYNPNGPHLPPPQASLADDYRRELGQRFDIVFNELWAIANMPIKRWRDELARQGKLRDYMQLLVANFNPAAVDGLMCRHQVHVDCQGDVYDCDFNYGVGLPALDGRRKLWEHDLADLEQRLIATAPHCFGCTAGAGSSCGGALT